MRAGERYTYVALVFVILSGFIVKDVFGIENHDIFDDILGKTNSIAVETGMTVYYETKNDGKAECVNWLKRMNIYDPKINNQKVLSSCSKINLMAAKMDVDVNELPEFNSSGILNNITLNDEKVYCREFQNGSVYGYIESRKEEDKTKIEIYIRKLSGKNEIDDLWDNVKNSIGKRNSNIAVYKYLKCRNSNENTSKLQYDIKHLLMDLGAINIAEIKVNKGYSTVAFTNKYAPVKDNGKLIDLNYAVLKANGENYILIATPIIDITY